MLKHQLSEAEIDDVLSRASIGHLSTVGPDGYPYVTPVHFVHKDGVIYIHGAIKGQRNNYIKENPKVSFAAALEEGLIDAPEPCDTNTRFKSVVVKGDASITNEKDTKLLVLDLIVKKYTPQHIGKTFPDEAMKITGITAIKILAKTGKYYT
jgi:nitroimidazol reductase NimA-like FMN-containing flavoprotein (pyridoxamine 5'-phosphate oxidase superfamily)